MRVRGEVWPTQEIASQFGVEGAIVKGRGDRDIGECNEKVCRAKVEAKESTCTGRGGVCCMCEWRVESGGRDEKMASDSRDMALEEEGGCSPEEGPRSRAQRGFDQRSVCREILGQVCTRVRQTEDVELINDECLKI